MEVFKFFQMGRTHSASVPSFKVRCVTPTYLIELTRPGLAAGATLVAELLRSLGDGHGQDGAHSYPLMVFHRFQAASPAGGHDSLMGSFVVAQPPPAAKAKALDTSDMRAGQAAALVGFTGPPPPSRPNAGPAGAMRA